jgi:6-pyruvoyltetrahydropterin/6-carboxytetrahydropterin synthase
MLHGYSIGLKLVFESETLDDRNWCFDFGGMKPFKAWLDYMFDHTLLIAEDDPELETFKHLNAGGERGERGEYSALTDLRIVPGVGCEAFAKMAYDKMSELLEEAKEGGGRYPANPGVRLVSVEVFEHGANSAIYLG